MSLTSALLGGKAVDSSLDSLFKNSAGPSKATAPIAAKVRQPYPEDMTEEIKKKQKTPKPKTTPVPRKNKNAGAPVKEDQVEDFDDEDADEENITSKKGKVSVEAKYEAKLAAAPKKSTKSKEAPKQTQELVQQQSTHDYGEDVDMEESKIEDLVHESLRKAPVSNKRKAATSPPEVESSKEVLKKQKTAAKRAKSSTVGDSDDEDASPDANKDGTKKSDDPERQARTVFVGNLPVTSMTKGDFRKLKSTFAAFGAVESIRFRSIAFAELLPRKIAFITGKLHPERDVVNAYIVFANKDSVDKAVKAMNGQLFLTKHIRVDTVAGAKNHQPKKSVFVGNLSFDAQEEDLWNFFKDSGDIENVRIIRDKKTNLGKGFAYVQFQDRASVDMALRLHDTKMGTRKLRVVRCKRLEEEAKTNGMGPRSNTAVAHTKGKDGKGATRAQHAPIVMDGAAKRLAFKDRKTKEKHILMKKKTGAIVEGERSQKGAKVDLGIKKGKTKVKANVPKKKVVKK
ncbi:nucleolar protein 12 [Entomortierella parvispora]|uniref:Nucleolar protein 12 n=1 Tax=Entomortierella parvispora TaxID=205924 RepID=A0A9P3HKG8_9FUNG|nr:nucleolar protein 12 [Entomortierella parvispora]